MNKERSLFYMSPVDATSEGGRLVEAEPRGEERRVVKEPDQVLHCLVALVRGRLSNVRNNSSGAIAGKKNK